MTEELRFWGAVALVAVVAVIGFKLTAASRVGEIIPGLPRLAGVI